MPSKPITYQMLEAEGACHRQADAEEAKLAEIMERMKE